MSNDYIFAEKYRPTTISECILPKKLKEDFNNIIAKKTFPNLLFVGGPGTCKTSAAKSLLNDLNCDYIMINGSLEGNIDTLRTKILNYASTKSFKSGRKYIILDEAENLNSNSTQPSLRNFMEQFASNAGFILTCNYENKIIPPLLSRLSRIDFSIPKDERIDIASQFVKRCFHILEKEEIKYDKAVIIQLVKKYFPDFRKTLNELQRASLKGEINSSILSTTNTSFDELIKMIRDKDILKIRKWTTENNITVIDHIEEFYDSASKYFTDIGIATLILILDEYQYREAFVINKEIHFVAMCVEISNSVEWK